MNYFFTDAVVQFRNQFNMPTYANQMKPLKLTETLILSMLERDNSHAYILRHMISSSTYGRIVTSSASMHCFIKKLEYYGYIEPETREINLRLNKKPTRIMYRITERGSRRLREESALLNRVTQLVTLSVRAG